jgi:hypothetical protein
MWAALRTAVLTVLALSGVGCVVVSVQPYADEEQAVEVPQVIGQWQPLKKVGDGWADVDGAAWTFAESRIVTVDEDGRRGPLEARYFRLDGRLYLDAMAGDPDKLNAADWWTVHVVPVHTLCRVEIEGDRLALVPLSWDWLEDRRKDGELGLSSAPTVDDGRVYTCTTAEWQAFLKEFAGRPDVFVAEHALRFRRVVPAPE